MSEAVIETIEAARINQSEEVRETTVEVPISNISSKSKITETLVLAYSI